MKGIQPGITDVYPKASHLTEAMLFRGYGVTDLEAVAPIVDVVDPPEMTPLERRQRILATHIEAAEARVEPVKARV